MQCKRFYGLVPNTNKTYVTIMHKFYQSAPSSPDDILIIFIRYHGLQQITARKHELHNE